jgi:hypothetical protein
MGKNFEALTTILSAEKTSDLTNHCRTTTLYGTDLTNLVFAAEIGLIAFRHRIHHREFVPKDIQLRDTDLSTMAGAKPGPMDKVTAKAFGRVDQIFEKRRLLTGHLFFLPDLSNWTLFYFDQRDTSKHDNHWQHGSHVHVIRHLWPNWSAESVWKQFTSGSNPEMSGALHVRFDMRDYAS